MPRGGSRPGAGRKAGSRNRPKYQLGVVDGQSARKTTAAERNQAQRDLVAALVAQDLSHDAIAAALHVTVDQLKAAFPKELEHGHAITKAKITASLLAGVDADRVAAARKLDEMVASKGAPSAAGRIGKKEAAKLVAGEAVRSGGKFAPRPTPRGSQSDAPCEDFQMFATRPGAKLQ